MPHLERVVDKFKSGKWSSFPMATGGLDAAGRVLVRNRLASTMPTRAVAFVKQLFGWIALWVHFVLCIIIICCCRFGIFRWGVYIATGVSLWRLKQHDYGKADENSSKSNMSPALDVLYIIVVVQGAILVYIKRLDAPLKKRVAAEVAKTYGFKGPSVALVQDYMIETQTGCAKSPSFAKGRNLVTYAVDLMGPDKSPQDYLSGLTILSTILGPLFQESKKFEEQCMLIRQLILYAPSSHIFGRLLVLSNPRSCAYGREKSIQKKTRNHAASIVLHLTDGASLEQLPQVIECISSLIGTFEDSEYYPEEGEYLERLWECLHVLFVLAADENNCKLIVHTRGLLTKIMTPLTSDLYHQSEHNTWGEALVESLKVLQRLTAAYCHEETLLHEISTNQKAVQTIFKILTCDDCDEGMKTLAMGITTNLHMHMQTPDRLNFIEVLADIYTYTGAGSARVSALEALATLCSQDGSNANIILQVNGSAVYSFTDDLDALSDGYQRHHTSVAEVLQHACVHYTSDDEYLRILKESMTDVMPKVLNKILTVEATQTGQQGDASQTNGQSSSGSSSSSSSLQEIPEEHDILKIQIALLSLCVTIYETFLSADQYLAVQFDEAIGEFTLPVKLREMVQRNSEPTTSCLKILKHTSRMVISVMKCTGSRYPKQDLESLVEALSSACSRKMYIIDSSMDFTSGDDMQNTRTPERALWSFVTEATDLVHCYREPEVMSPSTIVGGELSSN